MSIATISSISSISSHPNADRLEIASLEGKQWRVVVRKDDFVPSQKVLYCEIDSFLPILPEYEFLRSSSYKNTSHLGEGFKIRTARFRGELSQGLILPLSPSMEDLPVGSDVSTLLNIRKWEMDVPPSMRGKAKGNFPSFIRKTNQERIQNVFSDFTSFSTSYHDGWVIEEKVNGTSCTIYHNNGDVGICSRNYDLLLPDLDNSTPSDNLCISISLGLLLRLKEVGENVAIQGEIVGPGIQDNYYKLPSHSLYIFDIFSITHQRYLSLAEREDYLSIFFNDTNPIGGLYNLVPSVKVGCIPSDIDSLLSIADSPSCLNSGVLREGVVIKSMSRLSSVPLSPNEVFSFKIVSNKYLLKEV